MLRTVAPQAHQPFVCRLLPLLPVALSVRLTPTPTLLAPSLCRHVRYIDAPVGCSAVPVWHPRARKPRPVRLFVCVFCRRLAGRLVAVADTVLFGSCTRTCLRGFGCEVDSGIVTVLFAGTMVFFPALFVGAVLGYCVGKKTGKLRIWTQWAMLFLFPLWLPWFVYLAIAILANKTPEYKCVSRLPPAQPCATLTACSRAVRVQGVWVLCQLHHGQRAHQGVFMSFLHCLMLNVGRVCVILCHLQLADVKNYYFVSAFTFGTSRTRCVLVRLQPSVPFTPCGAVDPRQPTCCWIPSATSFTSSCTLAHTCRIVGACRT